MKGEQSEIETPRNSYDSEIQNIWSAPEMDSFIPKAECVTSLTKKAEVAE